MTTSTIKQPKPVVLFGPSGAGKSTLLKRLLNDFSNKFGFSISHTTRKPRNGEVDGEHYHFTTIEQMEKDIADGKFIESAKFGNNLYGTSIKAVQDVRNKGLVCILDIDVQGVIQVKKTDLNPFYIFIQPPSLEILRDRLIGRGTETEESLKQRLEIAQKELVYGLTPNNADLILINDDLETTYEQLKTFIEQNVLL